MSCTACGAETTVGEVTCSACGAPLTGEAAAEAPAPAVGPHCPRHPETPAIATCARCGAFGCGACLAGVGGQWVCGDCRARVQTLPWDERASLGVWRAWWRTCTALMFRPGPTLEHASRDGDVGGSLLFALLSSLVGYAPTLLGATALGSTAMFFVTGDLASKGGPGAGGQALIIVGVLLLYGVLAVTVQLVSVVLLALIDHLGLRLVGAPPADLRVTLRAEALSSAPMLCGLVPVCSVYVFPLWVLVLRVVALVKLRRASVGTTVLVVLAPVALCCTLWLGAQMVLGFAGALAR